jgi:AcrR family transcriptional regulator
LDAAGGGSPDHRRTVRVGRFEPLCARSRRHPGPGGYHHFESKEAIAVELVEAHHADLVRVVREFGSVPADPLPALRAYAQAIAAVSFRHPAALQISVFDAPTTASSSLKTVVHAEPASVDRLWRTLISAAAAAGAIKDGVDLRILRYVLHRTTLNAGLLWGWQTPSGTLLPTGFFGGKKKAAKAAPVAKAAKTPKPHKWFGTSW